MKNAIYNSWLECNKVIKIDQSVNEKLLLYYLKSKYISKCVFTDIAFYQHAPQTFSKQSI